MRSPATTVDDLVAEMHAKGSVLQGWDVLLNLPEATIGKVVRKQWSAAAPAGTERLAAVRLNGVQQVQGESHALLTQIDLELGPPSIQLQSGRPTLTVRQSFLSAQIKSGTIRAGTSTDPGDYVFAADDPGAIWGPAETAVLPQDSGVNATVPLSVVPGSTAAAPRSVVLDFSSAEFALENMPSGPLDEPAILDRLRRRSAAAPQRLVVAAVDLGEPANELALEPASLKLNTMQSSEGDRVLQFLFATGGEPPDSASTNVLDPVPSGSGFDYSLMIGSKAVIQDIVVPGFNQGTGLVKLVAVPPASPAGAWYAQTRNPMQFQGTVRFGGAYPDVSHQTEMGMNFLGSPAGGLAVAPYTGPNSNISLQLGVSATYPLKTSSDGQQVAITAGPASVTATGLAENAVKAQLESFLNDGIKSDMTGVSLAAISNLVQKNLTFPGHALAMSEAHFPGDFLILGTFEEVGA
jgi:hypothetical protein